MPVANKRKPVARTGGYLDAQYRIALCRCLMLIDVGSQSALNEHSRLDLAHRIDELDPAPRSRFAVSDRAPSRFSWRDVGIELTPIASRASARDSLNIIRHTAGGVES